MIYRRDILEWAYDLHIHTVASPCGDDLMTPHNIVNMSLLKGLDVIAITDHQTMVNCEAVMRVGKAKGLQVIPGMEIEGREEFHLIALFKDLDSAYEMQKWLWTYLPPIQNKSSIFGKQLILNEKDECIGEIEQLLLVAAQVGTDEILKKANQLRGLIYPAHIDRKSYSILSNLGSIPIEYPFVFLEISKAAQYSTFQKQYPNYTIIQSSDAHYLQDIAERENKMDIEFFKDWIGL